MICNTIYKIINLPIKLRYAKSIARGCLIIKRKIRNMNEIHTNNK